MKASTNIKICSRIPTPAVCYSFPDSINAVGGEGGPADGLAKKLVTEASSTNTVTGQ